VVAPFWDVYHNSIGTKTISSGAKELVNFEQG